MFSELSNVILFISDGFLSHAIILMSKDESGCTNLDSDTVSTCAEIIHVNVIDVYQIALCTGTL